MNKPGVLITFEGIDGSGKSTQAVRLHKYLRQRNYEVTFLREPGGTIISEQIRKILLDNKNHRMKDRTELLLYLAARSEVVDKVIQPAIARGEIVIADRFYDSTYAYQIHGRRLPERLVRQANRFAAAAVTPDITFLVDLSPKIAHQRLTRTKDRLEAEGGSFHSRVRNGFLKLAERERSRIKVLDGRKSEQQVWQQVLDLTLRLLRRREIAARR